MVREWKGILGRYGQSVTLRQGEKAVQLRALVQPVLEEGRPQAEPTPLGLGRRNGSCIWARRSTPWTGTPGGVSGGAVPGPEGPPGGRDGLPLLVGGALPRG